MVILLVSNCRCPAASAGPDRHGTPSVETDIRATFERVRRELDTRDPSDTGRRDEMSFGAFFQIARLFGGQLGTTAIQVFTRHAEQTHSQLLGSHVGTFDIEVLSRLQTLATGLAARLQGSGAADDGAVPLLDRSVRALAYADGVALGAGVAIATVLMVLSLHKPP
jgi:DHA2 family multidrug resistance protein